MEDEAFNKELIVRYLLGDLPEEEQVRVEDRAFRDPQRLKDLLAVESDLIDEYVRGELSDRERRQFETRFLASAERRQKVEFARALAVVASESTAVEGVARTAVRAPASRWGSLIAWLRGPSLAPKFSLAAAALVLVIGISWLVTENIRLRTQLAQLRGEQQTRSRQEQALERQAADARARSEELARQLQQERGKPDRLQEGSAKPPSQPTVVSLVLWPGTARSVADRPKLVLPRAARSARLEIGLERGQSYNRFRVELLTRGGQPVWSRDGLRGRAARAGRAVVLDVPASVLHTGEYELALKGVMDKGEEDVGYYYFSVLKE